MTAFVGLPQVSVSVAGARLPAGELRGLTAVLVRQKLSAPALCELVFSDPPGPLRVAEGLGPGDDLRVEAGEGGPALFTGEVTAVEQVYGPAGQREIRVRGYDRLHRLRKRQPVRGHVQATVRDLARELARDLGVTVQAAAEGPIRPLLIQHASSDLELLAGLAAEAGLYLALRDDTLHLLTLAGLDELPMPLALGETLLEARAELSAEPATRAVHAAGWDPLRIEAHQAQAAAAQVGRRVAAAAPPARVGSTGQRNLAGSLLQSDAHARGQAQAELDRRTAYEVTLWGVAEGDPRLRPGSAVAVTGLAAALCGRHVLTTVTHTIDGERGYLSEISTAPPAGPDRTPWGREAGGAGATLGIVTAVNDPGRLGRVRAALPAYRDMETDWMHVVSPGAGRDKGLITTPDPGDRVLVLLPFGDPAAGVVLGGLWGMAGPPDSGVEAGRVRRFTLRTPGGQVIVLDDKGRAIHIEDSGGNVIELAPGKLRVHAAGDLELEAPGRNIVIRGEKIDFQRG